MSALLSLLGFAVLTSLAARRWLANASWTHQAPVLAIFVWQAVTFSVAGAVVLAGAALVLPQLHLSVDLAEAFRACVAELRHQYQTPAGAAFAVAGGVAALALIARFTYIFGVLQRRARSTRRSMRASLQLVGTPHPELDYVEVDHMVPLVYCVPGRFGAQLLPHLGGRQGRAVVVTRGAREALTPSQLEGVLAHEQAHLRARHDLAITAARALARTFFGLGIFVLAAERIAELAEMHADDATPHGQRRDLAAALLRLGTTGVPVGAMGARGTSAVARIRRLANPAVPLPGRGMAIASGAVFALSIAPLLLALVPTVLALFLDCCGGSTVFL